MIYILWFIILTNPDRPIYHPIGEFVSEAKCNEVVVFVSGNLHRDHPEDDGKWKLKCEPLGKPV